MNAPRKAAKAKRTERSIQVSRARREPWPWGPTPTEPGGRWIKWPLRALDGSIKYFIGDVGNACLFNAHRWRESTDGYVITTVYDPAVKKGRHLSLHRMVTNAPAGQPVDHRYNNKRDVRRCMLRFATLSQNSANRRADRRRRLAKYRGVTLHRQTGKWRAQCEHMGTFVDGGLHATEEAAALVYNRLAARIWGRFARLNRLRKLGSSRMKGRAA